jgi:hypothetical protein
VTFNLYADGADVLSETFATAAAAKTFFTDDAINLGSLASGPLSGSTLTLKAVLTVTSDTAGSGFYGDLIIGDPPGAAKPTASHQGLVAAMAGFGARSGGSFAAVTETRSLQSPTLVAQA